MFSSSFIGFISFVIPNFFLLHDVMSWLLITVLMFPLNQSHAASLSEERMQPTLKRNVKSKITNNSYIINNKYKTLDYLNMYYVSFKYFNI